MRKIQKNLACKEEYNAEFYFYPPPSEFTTDIEMLKNTDPNSNTLFNTLIQKLINNDTFMDNLIDALQKQVSEIQTQGLPVFSNNEQTLHRGVDFGADGSVWINYRGADGGSSIGEYYMGTGDHTGRVADVRLKRLNFMHDTNCEYIFKCSEAAAEQNSNTDWVKNFFVSMPPGIQFVYNTFGEEWTYIFSKRQSGTYGSVLRWNYNAKLQIMGYTNNSWATSGFVDK